MFISTLLADPDPDDERIDPARLHLDLDLERKRVYTEELIDYSVSYRRDVEGLTEAHIRATTAQCRRCFDVEVEFAGMTRRLNALDLLLPGGKLAYAALRQGLERALRKNPDRRWRNLSEDELAEKIKDVVDDHARALKRLLRFAAAEGGYYLPSGVDLRALYGALACPIGRVGKREPNLDVILPRPYEMPPLWQESYVWATHWREPLSAQRTLGDLALGFGGGLRGVEIVRLDLRDQLLLRTAAVPQLRNPLRVRGAKGGRLREVDVAPHELAVVNWWLAEGRPQLTDAWQGPVLPATHGDPLRPRTRSALTQTVTPLLDHLTKRRLLHPSFTFHATRKTFARHYLARTHNNVAGLLRQCGWRDGSQLARYLALHKDEAALYLQEFLESFDRDACDDEPEAD